MTGVDPVIMNRIAEHGGCVIRDKWRIRVRRGQLSDTAMDWLRAEQNRTALTREVWPEYDQWCERTRQLAAEGTSDAEAAAYREVMEC